MSSVTTPCVREGASRPRDLRGGRVCPLTVTPSPRRAAALPDRARRRRAPSRIMPHMKCPHAGRGGRAGASRPASAAEALRSLLVRLMVALPCLASSGALAQSPDASDWGYYGGDAFGQRFSSLGEINRGNVSRLKVVWTYRTGELGAAFTRAGKLTFEATPVLAFGLLYVETGTNIVIALDPESGHERWRVDPHIDRARHYAEASSRGVSVWESTDAGQTGLCRRRIFTGTLDARLLAQAAGTGAGNAWGVMTVDEEHGLVLLPTGSASPDFYGGRRVGSNRFANSLLALDARSGKLVWHRQLIHHDLWDYDLAAQPVLGDVEVQGVPVPAVIQATKTGMLYVFERTGGQPLVPITERPVPASHVPGEQAWPTQPFSSLPALTPQRPVLPSDAWGLTFWDRGKCRDLIASLRNEGIFTPPDTRGTLLSPGYIGGVNWGGLVFDEQRQRVIAAVNHLPMVVTLMSRQELEREGRSEQFPHSEFAPQTGTPYGMRREPLLSPWDLPCTAPPWGTLVSVDLRRARIVWQVPLGSTEGLTPWFVPSRDFGMPNMGGPIATDGELVFVSAAMDSYLRAFDIETGRELWKYKLPAGGQATPMTYRAGRDQHQYLVISAGGHGGLGTPRGDYLIAFALPAGAAARP